MAHERDQQTDRDTLTDRPRYSVCSNRLLAPAINVVQPSNILFARRTVPNHLHWWSQQRKPEDLDRCCWQPPLAPRTSNTAPDQSECVPCWSRLVSRNGVRGAVVGAATWWCKTRPGRHCRAPNAVLPTLNQRALPPGWQVLLATLPTQNIGNSSY